jgi:ATP-dependent Clp protease ATP-binding subunit ClpC
MFERYTENARRALFFARYEASQLGQLEITNTLLLLGLARSTAGVGGRILHDGGLSFDVIRRDIEARMKAHDRISTSVEIPFNAETKLALNYAAEEADRLGHRHIGTEHLLLGILREGKSTAAAILAERGLRLTEVREAVLKLVAERPPTFHTEVSALIQGMNQLLDRLSAIGAENAEARSIIQRIRELADALRRKLGG